MRGRQNAADGAGVENLMETLGRALPVRAELFEPVTKSGGRGLSGLGSGADMEVGRRQCTLQAGLRINTMESCPGTRRSVKKPKTRATMRPHGYG